MDVKPSIQRQSVITDIVQSVAWGLRRFDGPAAYPSLSAAPYAPHEAYPEFPLLPLGAVPNPVYGGVRGALCDLGLDATHVVPRNGIRWATW